MCSSDLQANIADVVLRVDVEIRGESIVHCKHSAVVGQKASGDSVLN